MLETRFTTAEGPTSDLYEDEEEEEEDEELVCGSSRAS
jgi:hypothetical protein